MYRSQQINAPLIVLETYIRPVRVHWHKFVTGHSTIRKTLHSYKKTLIRLI